jgi:hypothetical protein
MATSKFETTRSVSVVLCRLIDVSPVASVVGVSGGIKVDKASIGG